MNIVRRMGARRTGKIGLAAAAAAVGVVAMAGPAFADFWGPKFDRKSECEAARPSYKSSWTTPGPCIYHPDGPNGAVDYWTFRVDTVG